MPFIGLDSALQETSDMVNNRASNIRRIRQHISLFLLGEAKRRAPHKTGQLESGISSRVQGTQVFVEAGGGLSARYAEIRHDRDYNLGEGSRRKQSSDNVKVGKNYIKRAIVNNKKKILDGLSLVNAGKLQQGMLRITK